jgi:hypothetical protein
VPSPRRCEGGRVVNVAVVIATAVNCEGHREVLGMDVITTEDRTGWTAFLRGRLRRQLDPGPLTEPRHDLGEAFRLGRRALSRTRRDLGSTAN